VKTTETIQEGLKKVTEEKPAEKKEEKSEEKPVKKEEPVEDKDQPLNEDQYKIKATTLYAGLSDEQRAAAEATIKKLPEEVRAVAQTSFEAKYMILSEMYPDAQEAADDGSIFGSLKKEAKKKSPSDVIREAMAVLRGGQGNPERKGSGFVPAKEGAPGDVSKEAPTFDIMGGLYKG
jgi:hypothetical protein